MEPLWETVWKFLRDLRVELPHDPTIPVLMIHRGAMKHGSTNIPVKTHNNIIHRRPKMETARMPLTSERTSTVRALPTVGYHSPVERKEAPTPATTG